MIVTLNDVSYYVEIEGEGPPLLLLHGFTGSLQTWAPFLPMLTKKHKVITIDIIGHGLSQSPENAARYTMENVSADLLSLLNQLEIEKINIVGYSMGGRLALYFAHKYPERVNKLILESSSPGLETKEEQETRVKQDETLANFIKENGIKAFVEKWENIPLFNTQKALPDKVQDKLRKERLNNNIVGLANSLQGMGTGIQPSLWDKLSSLEIPILLVVGEKDEKFCVIAEKMKNLLQNAQIKKISQAGHAIHLESPQTFVTIIVDYLHTVS
ncbi:2-succinyl-6-hydroxy-2,4-cyclohexadiene-1-carboxylate synthase [Bacillus taeanensis]|uniref:Putative 2-succinyl-6-hydroxy-2,4-cyclohexadiene-1-carboxylate synthase n=1 Tax=Bacillus taeanensis TaxID=273032 RepID=A0A366Y542_9BACI|nr:2-succinyl-6-hydroxy-2,4-cyclohexadiene-1-carboxylate synthase [Bacillus taeanensis]RBW71331.1 2-succinyl-6-hydroxy-2,4-cyclohexadiene-1-carboxylate synthase [Bacillus taeanensis]